MKKRVLPLYSIIASAISFLLLVFWVVLQGMAQKGVLFYIGPNGFTANTLLFVVFLTCALGASAVVVYACLRVKKKLLQIVLIVAVMVWSAVLLLLASMQSLICRANMSSLYPPTVSIALLLPRMCILSLFTVAMFTRKTLFAQ